MAAATLQQRVRSLFAGYPNNSKQTADELITYIFALGGGTFSSLLVEGDGTIEGDLLVEGNLTVEGDTEVQYLDVKDSMDVATDIRVGGDIEVADDASIDGQLGVIGAIATLASMSVGTTLFVSGAATFGNSGIFGTTLTCQALFRAASALPAGVVIQLGADADMHLAVSAFTPGKEVYLLNQNTGGVVIVGGGDGDGTGTTMIGVNAIDEIGFYNQGTGVAQQTLPAAIPVDDAAMRDEWQAFKTNVLFPSGLVASV